MNVSFVVMLKPVFDSLRTVSKIFLRISSGFRVFRSCESKM